MPDNQENNTKEILKKQRSAMQRKRRSLADTAEARQEQMNADLQFGNANLNPSSLTAITQNNQINDQLCIAAIMIIDELKIFYQHLQETNKEQARFDAMQLERELTDEEKNRLQQIQNQTKQQEEKMRELMRQLAELQALQEQLEKLRRELMELHRDLHQAYAEIRKVATQHFKDIAAAVAKDIKYASFDLAAVGIDKKVVVSSKDVAERLVKAMPDRLIKNKVSGADIPEEMRKQIDVDMKEIIREEIAKEIKDPQQIEACIYAITQSPTYQEEKAKIDDHICGVSANLESRDKLVEVVDHTRDIENKMDVEVQLINETENKLVGVKEKVSNHAKDMQEEKNNTNIKDSIDDLLGNLDTFNLENVTSSKSTEQNTSVDKSDHNEANSKYRP